MEPLAPADNDYTVLDRVPWYLTSADLLAGLGLIEDTAGCPVEVEKDGRTIATVLPTGTDHDESAWPVAATDAGAPVPLYQRDPQKSYFLELIPEHDAAYLLFRRVQNDEGESFAQFCERAFATLDEKKVDRLVVDLRQNGGGNNFLNRPLIHGIIRNDLVNRPGHLFVITGRATFSAAMCGTIDLERQTHALFAGEPTGASPNHHGDAVPILLPNTGVTVTISAVFWQNSDPRDHRPWVEPDLPVELTWDDSIHGRDPVLEATLAYTPYDGERKNVAPTLIAWLDEGQSVPHLLDRFDELRATPEGRTYVLGEYQLNALGYELLGRDRMDEALTVFRRNVELFPWSANPWDSLGEALVTAGHLDEAIEAYRRSVELNPSNRSGQTMLRRLARGESGAATGTN
jgi:tetratricopeptide (TPR) repeat protein